MSNINFRKTRSGNYAAEYQRNDGLGFETRYFRPQDLADMVCRYDDDLSFLDGESGIDPDATMAEVIIRDHCGAGSFRIIS